MTTVEASNLGKDVTEKQVNEFFSFCGKIQKLELRPDGDKQRATITFERPSAARTALLLQDAHLGSSQVQVTSTVPLDEAHTPPGAEKYAPAPHDFSQEDKPHTAVLAEYLSHGYTLTDNALQKAIDYDHKNGISKRFYELLNSAVGTAQSYDQKLGVTQRAATIDEKYSIHERARSTASGLWRYFENALGTPTGKKVRSFYDDRKKEVLEIHNEARRLADERKAQPAPVPAESSGQVVPDTSFASEKTG